MSRITSASQEKNKKNNEQRKRNGKEKEKATTKIHTESTHIFHSLRVIFGSCNMHFSSFVGDVRRERAQTSHISIVFVDVVVVVFVFN